MKTPMPNNKDELHPQDKRNLIIFVVVSLVIWFTFDQIILKPRMDQLHATKEAEAIAAKKARGNMSAEELVTATEVRPRQEIISESARITLENAALSGSINLKGGRFDDVTLKDYYDTLDKKNNVALFAPAGSKDPEYADFGWLSKDSNIRTPNKNTVWSVEGNSKLAPQAPVTLYWENGQGLRFERTISLDDQYMFNVKRRVINNSGSTVTLFPYMLVAQRGMPADFFNRGIVHEGPIAYVNEEIEEVSYSKMKKKKMATYRSSEGWAGLSDHYWMTALVPTREHEMKYQFTYTDNIDPDKVGAFQVDLTGDAQAIANGSSYETTADMYVGTKNLKIIEQYAQDYSIKHFDLTVDFGMFYFITKPFYHVLMFFANLFGNFGVAILCLTLVVRAAAFPLANTTFKSFAGMAKLAPEMQKLKEKYKDDKAKLQQSLIKLYEKEKVNPMAGCLPLLIQIPIFFAVYKVLLISLEMRHAPFFGWIHDLSAPDPTTIFNLFGLIPWDPPSFMMFGVWSCFMLVFMILQKKLTPPPADPTQKILMYYFPYFISYILASFASGLVIYWTFSNALSVLQQYVILRQSGADIYLFKSHTEKKKIKQDQLDKIEDARKEALKKLKGGSELLGDDVIDAEEVEDAAKKKPAKPITKPKPKKSKKKK